MTCPICKKEANSFVQCRIKKALVCMSCCWSCIYMKQKETSIPKCKAATLDELVEE